VGHEPRLKPALFTASLAHGLKSLRKKAPEAEKTIPQRLKPDSIRSFYGTAEAVPFQGSGFFRKL
jgi:hypothetical protein